MRYPKKVLNAVYDKIWKSMIYLKEENLTDEREKHIYFIPFYEKVIINSMSKYDILFEKLRDIFK